MAVPLLMSKEQFTALSTEEKKWAKALELHLRRRFQQSAHQPLDDGCEVFLTVGYVQRLLRAVDAPQKGEHAARECLAWWQSAGLLRDTGKTKKPGLSPSSIAAREKFGTPRTDGGRDAQPSSLRSYWWRVFEVVPIAQVVKKTRGAYAHFWEVPQGLASLSAFLRRQGLIQGPRQRRTYSEGSVQWAFANTGPP